MKRIWCLFIYLLISCMENEGDAVVIEAVIDLDNDSEDLITSLISKVDAIIDPKVIDSKNATQELAYALLKLGPLMTVSGNITDKNHGFTVSFSFNAKAEVNGIGKEVLIESTKTDENSDVLLKSQGGILKPVVKYLEPYFIVAITILVNGIVSNVIAHLMNEVSLLSNTNLN